jgi:hypothetical protein
MTFLVRLVFDFDSPLKDAYDYSTKNPLIGPLLAVLGGKTRSAKRVT